MKRTVLNVWDDNPVPVGIDLSYFSEHLKYQVRAPNYGHVQGRVLNSYMLLTVGILLYICFNVLFVHMYIYIYMNMSPICDNALLTLKRPGLCGWLRPTQFKPRLDWVGSAAQVRRYCVDSAAQAFIHALAGCVPRSLQYALCGPRNLRSAHSAAHALDVLATHESPNLKQLST